MGTPGPYFTRENRDGVPILMGSPKFYDTGTVATAFFKIGVLYLGILHKVHWEERENFLAVEFGFLLVN